MIPRQMAALQVADKDPAYSFRTGMLLHGLLAAFALTLCGCGSEAARPPGAAKPADVEQMPEFPWPPPAPSAKEVIPRQLLPTLAQKATLKDVAQQLVTALDNAGYGDKSYYAIPNGFALVSRLEQFMEDGSPEKPPARFDIEVKPQVKFSLEWYLKALFTAHRGRFRLIVFAVTDVPFVPDREKTVSREEAMQWLYGMSKLSDQVGARDFTSNYDVIALIYEFDRPTPDHPYALQRPSPLLGRTHLQKAGLWPPWSK